MKQDTINADKIVFSNGTWNIKEVYNDNIKAWQLDIYSDECAVYDTMIRYKANKYGFDYADRIPDKIRSIAKQIAETDTKYHW